jgi:hypothetical protein
MKSPLAPSAALCAVVFLFACGDDPVQNDVRQQSSVVVAPATGHRHVTMLDDCDPNDPAWNATGGCVLQGGSVSNAEFFSYVASPLSSALIGHPAWTNDPTYLKTGDRKSFRVTNAGGRAHTFTEVASFGGGRVPPLNFGMTPSPECALAAGAADPNLVLPGGSMEVAGLSAGDHRFICCFHPWMRTLISVQSD